MSLEDLSRHERLLVVHAAYGRAMLDAHSLELTLCTLLFVRAAIQEHSESERQNDQSRLERLTLGELMREFNAAYSPSENIQEELDNMLYFRNELTHRISQMILLAATRCEWEARMIEELSEISQMFRETKALLEPFIEDCWKRLGCSDEKMREVMYRLYPGVVREV